MLCVLLPQGNRFCSKWRNHRVRRGVTPSLPIRSQYSRTLQQPNLLQDRFERAVVKRAQSLFESFCDNFSKQVALF